MHSASKLVNRQLDQTIARVKGNPISVFQFSHEVLRAERKLPDHRFVINLYTNPYDYLVGFCASTLAGQCTLMPPNHLKKTVDEIRSDYPDCYVMGPQNGGLDVFAANSFVKDNAGDPAEMPPIPDSQLVAIAFTSGSTGKPKANLKYWQTIREGSLSNVAMLLRGIDGPVNVISTVPAQHMWGMETSILLELFADTTIGNRVPFYPQDVKEALENIPEPRLLVSTPMHLSAISGSGLEFVPVRRVLCATAPLSASLAERVETLFRSDLLEVFGCTESGIIASRFPTHEEEWTLSDLFNLDGCNGQATISARHLPNVVSLQDKVEKIDDLHFRWLGRHQDLVNIAGKRGSLVDLNRRLCDIAGVTDGVMFFPTDEHDRLAALVVAPDLNPAEIREALREQVDPAFIPRPIVKVDHLPRSSTGKLPRTKLVDLFEQVRQRKGTST